MFISAPNLSRIRPYRFFMVLIIVCSIVLSACARTPSQQEEATPTPIPTPIIPTKPTYTVQRGNIDTITDFTGRISPTIQSELFFRKEGRVNNVYIKKGDTVNVGQLLADLETGNREFDIRRAQANLDIARYSLDLTKQQMPSWTTGYTLTLSIKEREVELAQINLDELNKDIADARIVSPITGTVLSISLLEGMQVDAYKPVLVVADINKLEVSADLMSEALTKLVEGMKVSVQPVGRPGKTIDGTIRRLPYPYGGSSSSNASDKEDKTTRVALQVDPTTLGYELGDMVKVTVVLEHKESILWVPPQAIRTFEGRKFVVVQDDQGQRRVDVKLGLQSEDRVEITDGLTEGQVVLAP